MQNKLFLKAADICELLEVKQTSAYEIIGNLNKELEEQGYLTLRGKVPTKYFVKRFYGAVWAFDYDKMFCVLMENEICRKVCEKNKYNSWTKLIGNYCVSMA